jgi:steroid delta-isomerase-like uncharacterized protein
MRRTLIASALIAALTAPTLLWAQDMEGAEALVRDYLQAWNDSDVDGIVSFFAEDGVYEDVANVDNGWTTPWEGHDAIHEAVSALYAGTPDFGLELHDVHALGSRVTTEWTMTGTQTGDWPGLPATGRSFEVRGISLIELDGGSIRSQRDYYDVYLLLSQLGVVSVSVGDATPAGERSTGDSPMTTPEENKELIRRAVAEGVNTGDLDVFREMLAPDYARHSQATTDMPEIRGIDPMLEFLEVNFTAFPDWHEEILLMIAEDDKVAYITRGTATHTGPLGDIPPTGREVEVMNYIVQRIEAGKIAETWIGWDNLAVLTQLGLFPPPDAGGE